MWAQGYQPTWQPVPASSSLASYTHPKARHVTHRRCACHALRHPLHTRLLPRSTLTARPFNSVMRRSIVKAVETTTPSQAVRSRLTASSPHCRLPCYNYNALWSANEGRRTGRGHGKLTLASSSVDGRVRLLFLIGLMGCW